MLCDHIAGRALGKIFATAHRRFRGHNGDADGAANFITAAICKITSDQPASVCSSAAVTAVTSHL